MCFSPYGYKSDVDSDTSLIRSKEDGIEACEQEDIGAEVQACFQGPMMMNHEQMMIFHENQMAPRHAHTAPRHKAHRKNGKKTLCPAPGKICPFLGVTMLKSHAGGVSVLPL